MRMTMSEFYSEAAKSKRSWYTEPWCVLTWKNMPRQIIAIRANSPHGAVCPITELYYRQTKKFLSISDYDAAAKQLGLRKRDARRIMSAADGWSKNKNRIRKRLLSIYKLS